MDSPLNITLGARMNADLSTTQDYRKLRKLVNHRIIRLRRELGLVTKDTKQYRDKEKISSISAEDYNKSDKYGLLLLLTAERDILYALQIKNSLEVSNEKTSSYKNLMISRIKKSLSTCKKLIEISANEPSEAKKVELSVYAALIQGQLAITKKQWSIGCIAFSIARVALDYLLSINEQEAAQEKNINEDDIKYDNYSFDRVLIDDLVENIVDPSLKLSDARSHSTKSGSDPKTASRKYCQEHAQLPFLSNAIAIIEKHDPKLVTIDTSVDLIKSVEWRSHTARIYNDEVALSIMKVLKASEAVDDKESSEVYDGLVTQWAYIAEVHKQDIERNNEEDDLDIVQDRAILLTYLNYNLLFAKLKRSLSSHCSEFAYSKLKIGIYDNAVSIVGEIKELPGVYNDDELSQDLEALERYFTAEKYKYLAQTYCEEQKYAQALKIFWTIHQDVLTPEVVESDQAIYKIGQFPYHVTNNQQFLDFKQQLKACSIQAHVLAQLASKSVDSTSIIENMNKYPHELNIVNFGENARIQSILSKPVLFDVGYNYVSYDLDSKSSASTASTTSEDKKKGGFFGIFGRS